MGKPTLIIANRDDSSWSLGAWLALEATGHWRPSAPGAPTVGRCDTGLGFDQPGRAL